MDFVEALKRPYSHGRSFFLYVIFMFIPVANFFSIGYSLYAARTAMQRRKLERWARWKDYFVAGFFMFVIGLVYVLPFLIVLAIAIVVLVYSASSGLGLGFWLAILLLVPFFIALLTLTGYVKLAAQMAFAERLLLGDAFKFRRVFRRAFTMEYFMGFLKSVGVSIIYGVIALFLSLPLIVLGIVAQSASPGPFTKMAFVMLRLPVYAVISYPSAITTMSILGVAYANTKRR